MNNTAYIDAWSAEHTTSVKLKFNNKKDKEILEWLNRQPTKTGAVRELIKEAIKKERGN